MQTAQLTFNGRTITEFFAVLFLFRCREKVRDPPNSPRSVICCIFFFSLFSGDTLVLQMGDTVGPRYTAPKISAISYLFRTFSLLIMGDTERPRYTGFRGLSVRGITALQCIFKIDSGPLKDEVRAISILRVSRLRHSTETVVCLRNHIFYIHIVGIFAFLKDLAIRVFSSYFIFLCLFGE